MHKFYIINGPNLNMLGKREKRHYGTKTLSQIIAKTEKSLKCYGKIQLEWFQSNLEGEIVTKIQEISSAKCDGLIINPGGYAHTSVAIYDALKLLKCEIAEVHISQIFSRSDFRQKLMTASAANIIMTGLGEDSYLLAIIALIKKKGGSCTRRRTLGKT